MQKRYCVLSSRLCLVSLVSTLALSTQVLGVTLSCPIAIRSPTPAAGARFGATLAIAGNRFIVGAPWQTGTASPGAAYVFDLTTRAHVKKLQRPTAAGVDGFGAVVGVVGSNFMVGAPRDNLTGLVPSALANAGALYIFDGPGASTSPLRTLRKSSPAIDDLFGSAAASVGTSIMVGAPGEGSTSVGGQFYGGLGVGAAYRFDGSATTESATYDNPHPVDDLIEFPTLDAFGSFIAAGTSQFLIGAFLEGGTVFDSPPIGAGAAYVFSATSPTLVAELHQPAPVVQDGFGVSLAMRGSSPLVGSVGTTVNGIRGGAAFEFSSPTDTSPRQFSRSAPVDSDAFGTSVAFAGENVVVGTPFDDAGATDAGSVTLSGGTTGALLRTFQKSAPAAGDHFGVAVAVSGSTILVGAPDDDVDGTDAGAVYVCTIPTCRLDVDGRDGALPNTDAVYIYRRRFGFSPLVPTSYRAADPSIPSDASIAAAVDALGTALDVDGSGTVDLQNDIVFLYRRLLRLGTTVPPSYRPLNPAIPSDVQINAAIDGLCP